MENRRLLEKNDELSITQAEIRDKLNDNNEVLNNLRRENEELRSMLQAEK